MVERTATCACGQLVVHCADDPQKVSLCHCLECQKRTGGPFGVGGYFRREGVTTQGEARTFARVSDGGHSVTFHFCPDCGSTVFWEMGRKPELMAVAVGAFADPAFPPPTQAVFAQHRHPWVCSIDI